MLPSMGSQRAGHHLTTAQQRRSFPLCVVGSLWLKEVSTSACAMADTSSSKRGSLCPCFPPLDSEQALCPILTREYGGPSCASCGLSPETPGTSTLVPGEASCCVKSLTAGRALKRATRRPQWGNGCPWPRVRAQAWLDGHGQLFWPVPWSLGCSS